MSGLNETINILFSKVYFTVVFVIAFVVFVLNHYLGSPKNLPPGPTGIPILGNALQVDKHPWLTFTKWKETYGPIIYLKVLGQPIIVLNNLKMAADILDRRARMTSDRPEFIVPRIMSGGLILPFISHNDIFRRMRKATYEGLHQGLKGNFHPTEYREGIVLAQSLLSDSSNWSSHIRRATASALVAIIYGKPHIRSVNDPIISKLNEFSAELTRAAIPGAYLVELFPALRHIPSKFAPWKRMAESFFKDKSEFFNNLFEDTHAAMLNGDEKLSFIRTVIETTEKHNLSQREVIWLASTLFTGAETSAGTISWWLQAMVTNPDTQRRAHEELDQKIGRHRLPNFGDFEQLPFIRAIAIETFRLHPVDPLGMPHLLSEDMWHDGYFMPKGTILIANAFEINRDPDVWGPDAHLFKPERHLDPLTGALRAATMDTHGENHVNFGFGRRICPGRHIANDLVFINIALIIWAMNIRPHQGLDGKATTVNIGDYFMEGLLVRPVPFKCSMTPRFPQVVTLLGEVKESMGLQLSDGSGH